MTQSRKDETKREELQRLSHKIESGHNGRMCRRCTARDAKTAFKYTATEVAAVAAYYNFARSQSRIVNLDATREHLEKQGIPLWIVEVALPGQPFDVVADKRVRHITVKDPLWHKESLLNIAFPLVPAWYKCLAWIDLDVRFERGDMRAAIAEALTRWKVVQLFDQVAWLGPHGNLVPYGNQKYAVSMGYRNAIRGERIVNPSDRHPGIAWAARRDVLEGIGGLYDGYPCGSGDVFSAIGFYGDFQSRYFRWYGCPVIDHSLQWARKAWGVVQGDVGYVGGRADHLYHGSRKHRRYGERHRILRKAGFDPLRHQRRNEQGIMEWSPECPTEITDWMAQYLLDLRKEDYGLDFAV